VTWRVLLTETALEGLADTDRETVAGDFLLWVENGPPRRNRRILRGIEVYEDELSSAYRVAYFINDAERYVAILRVRKAV
jgi:hypothetical protein